MGSASDKEVRVPIGIPVETNAKEASDAVAGLRDEIAASKDVIKDAATNLRGLRGSSDQVKAAKDQLKAVIAKEQQAITAATVKLVQHGTTSDRLGAQTRKLTADTKLAGKAQEDFKKHAADALKKTNEERVKALGSAVTKAGGPVASLRDKLKALGEIASGGGGMGVATLAMAGLAAAAVAAVAAISAAGLALASWAIRGADAARSLQLVRAAATTTSLNATHLGTQVDALAMKVPTATAALNDLASSLALSRLGGQTTVDTLNAVAQANAAIGEQSGAKIREIVERGKLAQRMFLGLQELQGSGLDFDDVAQALAGSMKIGVDKARQALLEGNVKLEDGAKAMRTAVEKKFGGINLAKMMSLEGLASTAHKIFGNLTKDINLEPAAQAAFKFLHAFDESTATGAVLKRVVTVFGNGVVSAIEKAAPIAKEFLRGMIVAGLQMYVAYLQVKNQLKDTFGDSKLLKDVDTLGLAMETGKVALVAMAGAAGVLAVALAVAAAPFVALWAMFVLLPKKSEELGKSIRDWFLNIDWAASGRAIVDGLVNGLTEGASKLKNAVVGLGSTVKSGFKAALGINSPSKVFAEFGKQTTAGYQKGVEASAPAAQGAVAAMGAPPELPAPGSAAAAAGGRGGAPITINVTVTIEGGGKSPTAQAQDPGFVAALTKTLKEAALAAGIAPA